MSVKLEVENIGGLRGRQSFNFKRGRVNIVESPNAVGKSSIIKALTAVISLPCITHHALEEAVRLGLKASSPNEIDPLINIYEDSAKINLIINGEERVCEFRRWREPVVKPRGNEKFIFAGILTRESRVMRYLAEGNDNFIWIVDTMSFAQRYETVRSQVEKFLTEAELRLDEINKKKEELTQIKQKLKELSNERLKIKKEYENLERELKKRPPEDPELKILFEKLSEEERLREREVSELEQEVEKAEEELIKPKMELSSIQQEINLLKREREKRVKELEALPVATDMKKWLERADKIEREIIPNLREERGEKVGVFNLLESALRVLRPTENLTCPLCGSKNIDPNRLYEQKEELKRQIAKRDKKIGELLIEADKLRGQTREVDEKRKDLERKISEIESKLQEKETLRRELERRILHPERKLKSKKADLEKAQQKLREVRDKLQQVEKRIKETGKERENLLLCRERLRERLSIIDKELEEGRATIEENSWITINQTPIPIDKAKMFYEYWVECLKNVTRYLLNIIREQRQGAARRFNSEVKILIKKLGFTEFEQIFLNEETYRLQVFRKGGRPQAISSLSSSERNALATLLQLAIKEAYIPEIPFFIIDEVVLDFDKKRVEKIIEYLADLAKTRNWCVVVTRLAGEGAIRVRHI